MNDEFYLRFEDKFRGSRDVVKMRQAVYLPIVEPIKTLYPESFALDLGCGRGEWLELLKEKGWSARGVDSNIAMIDYCKSLDLEVERADAVQYVTKLPNKSVAVITGFHIAEHLKFDDLVNLIHASFQALIPGGVLILETPNPENILVGTCTFYLDPTHRHPLPPGLMEFLAEEAGFYKYRTLRLNSSPRNVTDESVNGGLSQLLLEYPDYALIAQKKPAEKDAGLFALLDVLEGKNTSEMRSLEQCAADLESQLKDVVELLRQQLFDLQQKVEVFSHRTGVLETELANQIGQTAQREQSLAAAREHISTLEAKVQSLNYSSHHWWTVAEVLNKELQAVYASKSWRISWPLRKTEPAIKWIAFLPISLMGRVRKLLKTVINLVMVRAAAAVIRRPSWEALAINTLNRYPKLKIRLKNLYTATCGVSSDSPSQGPNSISGQGGDTSLNLPARARQIYKYLKSNMEAGKK